MNEYPLLLNLRSTRDTSVSSVAAFETASWTRAQPALNLQWQQFDNIFLIDNVLLLDIEQLICTLKMCTNSNGIEANV